jgi:glycosyltransferase involved in cell wall biosynthesis
MYEGFGMGVVEAIASSVPMVCAKVAFFPETADH